jgi:hypothetical protein
MNVLLYSLDLESIKIFYILIYIQKTFGSNQIFCNFNE